MAKKENLTEKIAVIAGSNSAKSTVDRDVVNPRKVKPRLTGPERQRQIHESSIFWDTYYKLKPKYEKKVDTKGKTKVKKDESLIDKVLKKGEKAKEAKQKKGLGFMAGMLMRNFLPMLLGGLAVGLAALVGVLGKMLWDKWSLFNSNAKEFEKKATEHDIWQKTEASKMSQKNVAKKRAGGDEIGAQMRELAQKAAEATAGNRRKISNIQNKWAYKLNAVNPLDYIGGRMKDFQLRIDTLNKASDKINSNLNKELEKLRQHPDYRDPANQETANAMQENNKLLRQIAGNMSGGGAAGQPTPTANNTSMTGPTDYNFGSYESGREAYMASPNSLNTPPVVAV